MKNFLFSIILLFACFVIPGCSSVPYVRSDVFVDREAVQSIYVMPIIHEVTLDSDFLISRDARPQNLKISLDHMREIINEEFLKRGYSVAGYSKNFDELDKNNPEDNLIRDIVYEFLEPVQSKKQTESDIVGDVLFSILKSADITVTDQDGTKKTLKQIEEDAKTKDAQQPEEIDPLVKKVMAAQTIIPKDVDTILLVKVESFIAKRGWWKKVTEDSKVTIFLTMVSVPQKKIIFIYQHYQDKSDVLDAVSFERAVKKTLEKIPVKL